ncbi:MAG: tetratricopeptide repeat protein [Treponema sp.]|jgi:tetratricopeptide (TPR) repeat protein|nr:tetratricopeptide repeat protein [Treponema sp.]
MKKYCLISFVWMWVAAICFGQANFTQGEELFMQNKPQDAVVYLENTIVEDPAHAKAFLYLGMVYEQLNRMDEAIVAYRRILPLAGDLTAYVANNLGNVYFKKGSIEEAESFYTQAIEANVVFSSAYLGRANTRIKSGSLTSAVTDYQQFLALEPRSPKRADIERLVSLIRMEFAEAERQRFLAEEAARAEAERKQRLMDEVSASLQSAANASQGLSSGAESVESYDGEFELE